MMITTILVITGRAVNVFDRIRELAYPNITLGDMMEEGLIEVGK